jgi:hypothetical protein
MPNHQSRRVIHDTSAIRSSTSFSSSSVAAGRSACSCRTFVANGNSEECAGNILHVTEFSFESREFRFKFCETTSRSWDIGGTSLVLVIRSLITGVTGEVTSQNRREAGLAVSRDLTSGFEGYFGLG